MQKKTKHEDQLKINQKLKEEIEKKSISFFKKPTLRYEIKIK
jgi:hypothetical protein